MKRFVFSLEPVLRLRVRVEEEKQHVLAAHLREHERACSEMRALEEEFGAGAERLRAAHRTLAAQELHQHHAHLAYLERCIAQQRGVVARWREAADAAWSELLEACKERRVMERLKERRREGHEARERLLEQRELDDANANRHRRWEMTG